MRTSEVIVMNFEIEPGIITSKLDLKDGDTIIITIDDDIYDFESTYEEWKIVSKEFPNNKILVVRKGIEINAADGPSPN